jgi:hypothetical protein
MINSLFSSGMGVLIEAWKVRFLLGTMDVAHFSTRSQKLLTLSSFPLRDLSCLIVWSSEVCISFDFMTGLTVYLDKHVLSEDEKKTQE